MCSYLAKTIILWFEQILECGISPLLLSASVMGVRVFARMEFVLFLFSNNIRHYLGSRSNSNLACDSLSCFSFFSCTVASVRKHDADTISATTPTTAKMNDQPGYGMKRENKLINLAFLTYALSVVGPYQRNCWHVLASIYLCFPKWQTL